MTPRGPEGVRLVWKEFGDEIDVQHLVTYTGVREGIHTFAVPVPQAWLAAWLFGRAKLCIAVLPGLTQVGLVAEDLPPGEPSGAETARPPRV